jgi:hypothetical protein
LKNALKKKLEKIFHDKMVEVTDLFQLTPSGDPKPNMGRWLSYLEEVGCRRVAKNFVANQAQVLIRDPVWFEDRIVVPLDLAEKALVLGLP